MRVRGVDIAREGAVVGIVEGDMSSHESAIDLARTAKERIGLDQIMVSSERQRRRESSRGIGDITNRSRTISLGDRLGHAAQQRSEAVAV